MSERDTGSAPVPPSSSMPQLTRPRYPMLHLIAILYRVLAALSAFAGLAGIAISAFMATKGFYGYPDVEAGVTLGIVSLLLGSFSVVTLLAASEVIVLLVDLEMNTREGNALLRSIIVRG